MESFGVLFIIDLNLGAGGEDWLLPEYCVPWWLKLMLVHGLPVVVGGGGCCWW